MNPNTPQQTLTLTDDQFIDMWQIAHGGEIPQHQEEALRKLFALMASRVPPPRTRKRSDQRVYEKPTRMRKQKATTDEQPPF